MKVKYKEKVYKINETPNCAYCDLNLSKCYFLCITLGRTKGLKLINHCDVL